MRAQGTVTRAFAGNAELPPTPTARAITAATIELEVSTEMALSLSCLLGFHNWGPLFLNRCNICGKISK